jgi:aryl-alcohol dehydrogenase-like predicted oxidoreductase
MNYCYLGKSDLRISVAGFGCMSLEREDGDGARLFGRALDGGVNFFDTADLYQRGMNEEMVGRLLKGRREEAVLCTKVGNQWRADGSGWDWNPRKEYIMQAAEASLRRLQTDVIDLYLLHGGTLEDPMDETIGAFEELQRQGKIRYYGLSSIRPNVIREYVRRSSIVAVMMQYSLLDRRPEESCLGLLHSAGVGVLARGGLAKGLLTGKTPVAYLGYTEEEVGRAAAAVASCSGPQRSAAQTALQFVLQHPAVSSAVVGWRTPEQLEDVLGTGVVIPLSNGELGKLGSAVNTNYYDQHL